MKINYTKFTKTLVLLMSVVLIISMSACSKNKDNDDPNSDIPNDVVENGDNSLENSADKPEEEQPVDENNPSDKQTPVENPDDDKEHDQPETPDDKPDDVQPSIETPTQEPDDKQTVEEKEPPKPVHTHSYTLSVVEPTCTTDGYTVHKCSCGNSYNDNRTSARGHLYGDWVVTTRATVASTGVKTAICTRCGHQITETIEKLPNENVDSSLSVWGYVGNISYYNDRCSLTDLRSWGTPPTITVFDKTSLHVVYYNKNNEKIEFDVFTPTKEGYVITAFIKEDGTYGTSMIGNIQS